MDDLVPDFTNYAGDFRDGTTSGTIGTEYTYDANGNMLTDANKDIIVKYNHLNLPVEVDFGSNEKIKYLYTASGAMIKKTIIASSGSSNMHYSANIVYDGSDMDHIVTGEGRIRYEDNNFKYEYFLKDHLGNVRVVFGDDGNGNPELLQEDHFYPYGMTMGGLSYNAGIPHNKYLYNGKEKQADHNLDWYAYGFRMMDPQLGRWHVVDAMAEKYLTTSPYAYVKNDPVNYVDLLGLERLGFDKHEAGGGWWFVNYNFAGSPAFSTAMNGYAGGVPSNLAQYGPSGSTGHFETEEVIKDWYQVCQNSSGEIVGPVTYLGSEVVGYNVVWVSDEEGKYNSTNEQSNQNVLPIIAYSNEDNNSTNFGLFLAKSRLNPVILGVLLSVYIIENWEEIQELGYIIGENISDFITEFTPTNDKPSNTVFGDPNDWVPSRGNPPDWPINGGNDPYNLGPGGSILLYGKLLYELIDSWQDASNPEPPPPPPGINKP